MAAGFLVAVAAMTATATPAHAGDDAPTGPYPPTVRDTEGAIEAAGYGAHVTYQTGDLDTVLVLYRGRKDDRAAADLDVARLVWQHEPARFDRVVVEALGGRSVAYTYDELLFAFGPRPPGLDIAPLSAFTGQGLEDFEAELDRPFDVLTTGIIVIGVGLFLTVACFALGSWAVTRRRELVEAARRS